jgi:hypothetical protein
MCWAYTTATTSCSSQTAVVDAAGGYGGVYVANAVEHTVRASVAFLNRAQGFYANHHPVANDYFNNTSYSNGVDYNMLGINSERSKHPEPVRGRRKQSLTLAVHSRDRVPHDHSRHAYSGLPQFAAQPANRCKHRW